MGDFLNSLFDSLIRSLKNFFQSIIDFFTSIADFFVSIWDWIILFFEDFFIWLWSGICELWDTISEVFVNWYESFIDSVFDLLPDLQKFFDGPYREIEPYLQYFGEWFAIDVAFSLLTAFFAFVVVMITVKLIIKLFIPMVG